MADSADANNLERKRVIRSRPNTREERLKQQKEWKKNRRERKRARAKNVTARQDGNADKASNPANDVRDHKRHKTKPSSPSPPKPSSDLRIERKDSKQPTKASSRGALMLQMVCGADVNFKFTQSKPSRPTVSVHRDARPAVKEPLIQQLKELNPDHLEYLSEHAVGSGSYGQCYRALYRGIEVIVKKMSHDHSPHFLLTPDE